MKFFILDTRTCKVIGTGFEAASEAAAKPMAREYLVSAGFPIEDNAKFILVRQVDGFSLGSNDVWSAVLRRADAPRAKRGHASVG